VGAVTTAVAAGPLRLTGHPLQRCGARAVVRLAEVASPEDITSGMLDEIADRLTRDIVRVAVAPDTAAAYDWWKVLFALYPNSSATHSKRSKVPDELTKSIARLFEADPSDQPTRPCAFCGQSAVILWAKDKLPMFDSMKAVNTLPPGLAGWPVCRGCRIAMWALPYGAWVTAGSATVLTCADDNVERRFVRRNVRRAQRIQYAGFTSLSPLASAETVTLAALSEHAAGSGPPRGATLWLFKNDNQEPWLKANATRGGVPAFLRRVLSEARPWHGWDTLQKILTQKDRNGLITTSGYAAAARLLFDPADTPGGPPPDRLQRELLGLTQHPDKFTGTTLTAWRELCRLHLEVVHGMDTGQLKPACELLTEWIMAEQNPRGRFNRYVKAAAKQGELQKLLMEANARLILDTGRAPDISGVARQLLAPDITAWRLRGQLYFDVLAELVAREAPIARPPKPGEGEEPADLSEGTFNPPDDENEGLGR
jgi:CRISPR-associated protein Cst1